MVRVLAGRSKLLHKISAVHHQIDSGLRTIQSINEYEGYVLPPIMSLFVGDDLLKVRFIDGCRRMISLHLGGLLSAEQMRRKADVPESSAKKITINRKL